jgi:hypothetical protein
MRQRPGIDEHDFVPALLQFDRGSNAINSRSYDNDPAHKSTLSF